MTMPGLPSFPLQPYSCLASVLPHPRDSLDPSLVLHAIHLVAASQACWPPQSLFSLCVAAMETAWCLWSRSGLPPRCCGGRARVPGACFPSLSLPTPDLLGLGLQDHSLLYQLREGSATLRPRTLQAGRGLREHKSSGSVLQGPFEQQPGQVCLLVESKSRRGEKEDGKACLLRDFCSGNEDANVRAKLNCWGLQGSPRLSSKQKDESHWLEKSASFESCWTSPGRPVAWLASSLAG